MRLRRDLPPGLQIALAAADELMASDPSGNIHSVGYGERTRRGSLVGLGIVVTVARKAPAADLVAMGSPLVPRMLRGALTDVQEQPEAKIQLLRFDAPVRMRLGPKVGIYHQQCHNTPIPGGVECFPIGQAWLGTLGCKIVYRDRSGHLRHGAITNWHVATGDVGTPLGQPGGNNEWFARVAQSPGVSFSGVNYVDLAVLDTKRTDGEYAPSTHTVEPKQVTLG
ncbi:MAG: hypothetical protein ACYTF1_26150, partial [Planctomycetota bacterium]